MFFAIQPYRFLILMRQYAKEQNILLSTYYVLEKHVLIVEIKGKDAE
jgi:hypothetical protein